MVPLLTFGRERLEVDLTGVQLTHHNLRDDGKRDLRIASGDKPQLPPIADSGSGSVQERQKAFLAEIIAKVNDLFEGDVTDDDRLIYVNNVIKGKLLESAELRTQAMNNTKSQFANSPTLANEILGAVMDALSAHQSMSSQALGSQKVREGLKDVLLGPAQLYETLRSDEP